MAIKIVKEDKTEVSKKNVITTKKSMAGAKSMSEERKGYTDKFFRTTEHLSEMIGLPASFIALQILKLPYAQSYHNKKNDQSGAVPDSWNETLLNYFKDLPKLFPEIPSYSEFTKTIAGKDAELVALSAKLKKKAELFDNISEQSNTYFKENKKLKSELDRLQNVVHELKGIKTK